LARSKRPIFPTFSTVNQLSEFIGNLSPRSLSRLNQGANFQIAASGLRLEEQIKNPFFEVTKLSILRKQEEAKIKAEQQAFKQTQLKAESDFIARVQSAVSKQLEIIGPGTIAQPIIETPPIESQSQIKQVEQSPTSLIPIAIIGVILGVVLLG